MLKERPLQILILLSALLLFYFFGAIIVSPNTHMLSQDGDGLKNYFTYAYYIEHNQSLNNFEGMNYPYGESIFYTDGHPALSYSLKKLNSIIPAIGTHSIGILNLFLLFSIFLSFPLNYLLLRRFHVEKWLALLFALAMGLLAPQLFRLGGHFALSYSIALPLSALLFLRVQEKNGILNQLLLFFNILFWLLTHAYLGLMIIAFQGLAFLFNLLRNVNRGASFGALLSTALPFFLFMSLLKTADLHSDRTDNPSGFFLYNAEVDDLLLPHHGPVREFIEKAIPGVLVQEWEAWSYIGIASSLMLVALFIGWLWSLLPGKHSFYQLDSQRHKHFSPLFLSAIVLFLFALCIPFRQWDGLIELLPAFKQLRATGRFAWPLFFTSFILIALSYQHWLSKLSKTKSMILLSVLCVLYGMEGIAHFQEMSEKVSGKINLFASDDIPADLEASLQALKNENIQAIIPIPFYHYGSESYARPVQAQSLKESLRFSYLSGLPCMGTQLTRVSISESRKLVQLLSPDYYPKEIASDIDKSKGSLLLIKSPGELNEYEQMLMGKANSFHRYGDVELYIISVENLLQQDVNSPWEDFNQHLNRLKYKQGFLISDSLAQIQYRDFEEQSSAMSFRGQGAYSGLKKGKNTFAEFPSGTFETGGQYHLSIWMSNKEKDALNLWFRLIVEEYDAETDQFYETTFFPEHAASIHADWSLVEGVFQVQDARNGISIVSKGKENSQAGLLVDELLIRPLGCEVYRMDEKELFYNNHRIAKK